MNLEISYLTIRKIVGILALSFPFLMILASFTSGLVPLEYSLSGYYWTNSHDVFIGTLSIIAMVLIFYKGYDKTDNIITNIAGVAMLSIALFPAIGPSNQYTFMFLSPQITAIIHCIAAIISLSLLGVMSFSQFTKTNKIMTPMKKKRNKIYKTCGIIIFIAIALMAPALLFPITGSIRLFLLLESIVMCAFGFSWFVKSEAILKDNAL